LLVACEGGGIVIPGIEPMLHAAYAGRDANKSNAADQESAFNDFSLPIICIGLPAAGPHPMIPQWGIQA
jgi:hypothetical protein